MPLSKYTLIIFLPHRNIGIHIESFEINNTLCAIYVSMLLCGEEQIKKIFNYHFYFLELH